MEEFIKLNSRYLSDIEDLIWDSRDCIISSHVGIRSIRQLQAFVACFPVTLCRPEVEIWLADLVYFGINVTNSTDKLNDDLESPSTDRHCHTGH